jgi:hypothetical protein
MALETYKILHNLAPVFLQNLLHTKNSKYYFRYRNILDMQIAELALVFYQVFFIFFSVQKCHAKGQKLKLLNIQV